MSQLINQKKVCAITNGDSLLGFALAYRILEGLKEECQESVLEKCKIRVLVRDKHGYDLDCLEKMGAEIWQVNYQDEHNVREAMKDVRYLTLIPENTDHRMKEAENVLKAARHHDVEHLSMLSIIGVNHVEKERDEFKNLNEYCQIEHHVKDQFKDKHCIIRGAKFYQYLYYFAPQIESHNRLPTLVKKDKKWVMVSLNDTVEGIWQLYKREKEDLFTHKRVWEFIGHKPMKTEDMARQIGEGIDRKDLKVAEVSENDIKQQLKQIKDDDRFQRRPDFGRHFHRGKDGYWSFPISKFLTNNCVEIMMEYWRLANKGKLEIESDDLRKVLDDQPIDLKKYFEKSHDQFKQFK